MFSQALQAHLQQQHRTERTWTDHETMDALFFKKNWDVYKYSPSKMSLLGVTSSKNAWCILVPIILSWCRNVEMLGVSDFWIPALVLSGFLMSTSCPSCVWTTSGKTNEKLVYETCRSSMLFETPFSAPQKNLQKNIPTCRGTARSSSGSKGVSKLSTWLTMAGHGHWAQWLQHGMACSASQHGLLWKLPVNRLTSHVLDLGWLWL